MTDTRLYIVFRADLPEMTRAKGEVQAAHAAGSLIFKHALRGARGMNELAEWMGGMFAVIKPNAEIDSAQPKVVMEVDDLPALLKVRDRAFKRSVVAVVVKDAAHTVFSEPTITCVAFGPCSKTDGNAITRGARMRV